MPEKQEEKKEEEQTGKAEASLKAQDFARERSKRFTKNLVMMAIIMTLMAVILIYSGMSFVFALICIGMLPGIVANILDSAKGRMASKTVIAFNLSGIMPHLVAIIASGMPNQTAAAILKNPSAWLVVYGFAAIGWGVVYVVPQITRLYFEIKASYMIKRFEYMQEQLVEEWGEKIKK